MRKRAYSWVHERFENFYFRKYSLLLTCWNEGLNWTTLFLWSRLNHKKNCPNVGAFLVRNTRPNFVIIPITRFEIVHRRCEIPFHSFLSGVIKDWQKQRSRGGSRSEWRGGHKAVSTHYGLGTNNGALMIVVTLGPLQPAVFLLLRTWSLCPNPWFLRASG